MRIELITKNDCPYCSDAKSWLDANGIPFEVLAVIDDYEQRQALYDQLGLAGRQRSVPQIWMVEADGTHKRIGGYSDLIHSDILDRTRVGSFDEEF